MVSVHLYYSCISCLLFQISWVTSGSCPAHSIFPSARQEYISYYLYPLSSFLNPGNLISYQAWNSWSRYNHSCVSHPQLQQASDWNIQYCHGWWHPPLPVAIMRWSTPQTFMLTTWSPLGGKSGRLLWACTSRSCCVADFGIWRRAHQPAGLMSPASIGGS